MVKYTNKHCIKKDLKKKKKVIVVYLVFKTVVSVLQSELLSFEMQKDRRTLKY